MHGPIWAPRVEPSESRPHGGVTLPADPRTAQRARAFLAAELGALLDDDALATVVLLASELVTNAVVHAASEVELFWHADDGCVTVGVRDADTGPMGSGTDRRGQLAESGRGLLIVDGLAQGWGTAHENGRKTIWFRVPTPTGLPEASRREEASRRDDEGEPAAGVRGTRRARDGATNENGAGDGAENGAGGRRRGGRSQGRGTPRLRSLLLPEPVVAALPYQNHVAEVLARLSDAVGAAGGKVTTVAGETVAGYGDLLAGGVRVYPLALAGRTLGALQVSLPGGTPDAEAEAFLRIGADRLAVLAYEQGVLRSTDGRAQELDFLSEATEMLTATLSVRTTLTLLPQLVVPRLAEWAAVYAVADGVRIDRVAVNHVREDAVDVVCERLDHDPALAEALRRAVRGAAMARLTTPDPDDGARTPVTVLPLTFRTRTLGVLVLGRPPDGETAALSPLLELARRAALAVDNARLHEEQAQAATTLQAALLPSALPVVPGVDLAARYHSASPGLVVGGDFYDAFRLDDGSLVCAVGDACGKGAEAASVTGMSRDLLRVLVRDGRSLPAALRRLNRSLIEDAGTARFCTVALTRLEAVGDDLCATICLAGHPEPVVLRADGGTDVVGVPGDLLGVMPGDIAVTEATVRLGPGDALVLYTDGVTERREGDRMFGLDGVRATLSGASGGDAARLAEALEDAARSFVATDLRDDLAIVVLRRDP